MKKKLLAIFGPILLAAVLLLLLFFSPVRKNTSDPALLQEASSSMSGNILRGNDIKRGAIQTGKYVPFFGSSELSRISPFHPSVLAEKYQRSYTPFLLGAPGTQSLTQFMMMQSLDSELKDQKAVFIISPQWFVKNGIKRDYFDAYYSPEQTLDWLLNLKKISSHDQYLAGRLLDYGVVAKDDRLAHMLDQVKQGQLPADEDLQVSRLQYNLLSREDELFSTIGLKSKQETIDKNTKALPDTYDFATLDRLADQIGHQETKGNPFEIQHHFYKQRIKPQLKQMAGSQKGWDYRYSTEFSDFQLALDQLAKEHTNCLFIIPPVNGRWAEYTGLSQPMLKQFASKIKYQLNSQGFNNIVDLTDKADVPYFMQDTIHLGWKGWLAADQYIEPFLDNKRPVSFSYQMNDEKFLSPQWQKMDPTELN